MNVQWVDHLNIRIPEDCVDEYVSLYRDALGFDLEHLESYRNGQTDFFYLRLTEQSVVHVAPVESFSETANEAFNHVALFVDEPRATVHERLEDAEVDVLRVVDRRLGATGEYPSIYFEDPFGYVVELKSPTVE